MPRGVHGCLDIGDSTSSGAAIRDLDKGGNLAKVVRCNGNDSNKEKKIDH